MLSVNPVAEMIVFVPSCSIDMLSKLIVAERPVRNDDSSQVPILIYSLPSTDSTKVPLAVPTTLPE